MAVETCTICYDGPGGVFEGAIAVDTALKGARPGILVLHNWLGQGEFDLERAVRLAELGYVGFAIDVYGKGKRASTIEEASALHDAVLADRKVLLGRMTAALELLKARADVDASRIAAIGFCLGGKCVLDLARSGADLRGVVSFHGVYDPPPFPNQQITARVLVCHGWDDPLCPPETVVGLAQELTDSGADWQIHAYGGAAHAFTAPAANMPELGLVYQPSADKRSWQAMTSFFEEVLD